MPIFNGVRVFDCINFTMIYIPRKKDNSKELNSFQCKQSKTSLCSVGLIPSRIGIFKTLLFYEKCVQSFPFLFVFNCIKRKHSDETRTCRSHQHQKHSPWPRKKKNKTINDKFLSHILM